MAERTIPDYMYLNAWIELSKALGERLQQNELDLMDGVLFGVIADDGERRVEIRDEGMLKGCIRHWESVLFHDKYLLDPSLQAIIESTVENLKMLQRNLAGSEHLGGLVHLVCHQGHVHVFLTHVQMPFQHLSAVFQFPIVSWTQL